MEYLQNFNYKISGNLQSKSYLVFLHGLMGAGINWSKISKSFHDNFQILTYDQRGHGRSFQPHSGYEMKSYASDLFQITEELGWDRIHLVGHSMGGKSALTFAGMYPEKLKSLVIEDMSPSVKLSAIAPMKSLINSVPVPFISKKAALDFFETKFLDRFENKKEGQIIAQFFNMNLKEKSSGAVDWRVYKPGILETLEFGRREDSWPVAHNLSVPTLFIYGENSGELSNNDIQRLKENPNIKTQCISDSGHWVHFDQPKKFVSSLNDFYKTQ